MWQRDVVVLTVIVGVKLPQRLRLDITMPVFILYAHSICAVVPLGYVNVIISHSLYVKYTVTLSLCDNVNHAVC